MRRIACPSARSCRSRTTRRAFPVAASFVSHTCTSGWNTGTLPVISVNDDVVALLRSPQRCGDHVGRVRNTASARSDRGRSAPCEPSRRSRGNPTARSSPARVRARRPSACRRLPRGRAPTAAGQTRHHQRLRRLRILGHRVGPSASARARQIRAASPAPRAASRCARWSLWCRSASPLSPRLLNFFQTRSRRSRRLEKVRNGSTLERVLTITHLPDQLPLGCCSLGAVHERRAGGRRDPPRSRAPSTSLRRPAPSGGSPHRATRAPD